MSICTKIAKLAPSVVVKVFAHDWVPVEAGNPVALVLVTEFHDVSFPAVRLILAVS